MSTDFPDKPSSGSPGAAAYPQVGFTIGEYKIQDILGQGAMSTVFLCRDATGHSVALKVFTDTGTVSKNRIDRFRREIDVSKELRGHPNIMTVYATGQDGPYLYIAMAHLPRSSTLEQAIGAGTLTIEETVHIAIKIARALAYAHHHNIVHRDVKPANILMDEFGEPILADLGVAALLDAPAMTVPGSLTGTPLYMSPEQARGNKAGPSSDLYSLAVVLYEALTGVLPFSSQHTAGIRETLKAVRDLPPRRPRIFREDLPGDLEAVLLKALAKDPSERYPDGEALARDLEHAIGGRAVEARGYTLWYRARLFLHRFRMALIVTAVLLLVGWAIWLAVQGSVHRVQYKELIGLARLRNAQHTLARVSAGEMSARGAARALQELHLQRQVMAEGRWAEALPRLATAAEMAAAAKAPEVAAAARIEQARCAMMLGDFDQAVRRCVKLLDAPDLPPSAGGLARFDLWTAATLSGGRDGMRGAASRYPPSGDEGLDALLGWLSAGLSARQIAGRAELLPPQYRNDGWFAAGLRAMADQDKKGAEAYFARCLEASRYSADWPAPLAEALRRGGGSIRTNAGAGREGRP